MMTTRGMGTEWVLEPVPSVVDSIRVGTPRQDLTGPLEVCPHPDKAISQRATVLAALADGTSTVRHLADCRDVRRNLQALSALGVGVRSRGEDTIEVTGGNWAGLNCEPLTVDVGNSATTSRLLLAMLAGSHRDVVVTGNELLRERPMSEVIQPLRAMGADLTEMGDSGRLPVRVRGTQLQGRQVRVHVDSAQPVSALAVAALAARGPTRIRRRTPARDHTERLLRWLGANVAETEQELVVHPSRLRSFDLTVPGDPSAAALLTSLHFASPLRGLPLTLRGVGVNPRRMGYFEIVRAMGAEVTQVIQPDTGPEPIADITVSLSKRLSGGVVEGPRLIQSAIDELPMIAALAAHATGPIHVRDASELRGKDTDRIATTARLLRQFGVPVQEFADGVTIEPRRPIGCGEVQLPPDHRIVFAGMVLAVLAGGGTVLRGVGAVATSHPAALTDLDRWVPVEAL